MSTTKQPVWKLVAQLGDVHPIEYGGYFVYVDETGVYPPEAELLEVPDNDDRPNAREYRVYRFILDPCTWIDGILSDNPYHPAHAAWFAKPECERADRPQDTTYLKDLADCFGFDSEGLASMFTSDDVNERATAWWTVGEYHGWENLDGYPLMLTRAECEARYRGEVRA